MKHFAAQCGFCYVRHADGGQGPAGQNIQTRAANKSWKRISGNICRCTGYEPIIDAILDAAQSGGGRRSA